MALSHLTVVRVPLLSSNHWFPARKSNHGKVCVLVTIRFLHQKCFEIGPLHAQRIQKSEPQINFPGAMVGCWNMEIWLLKWSCGIVLLVFLWFCGRLKLDQQRCSNERSADRVWCVMCIEIWQRDRYRHTMWPYMLAVSFGYLCGVDVLLCIKDDFWVLIIFSTLDKILGLTLGTLPECFLVFFHFLSFCKAYVSWCVLCSHRIRVRAWRPKNMS